MKLALASLGAGSLAAVAITVGAIVADTIHTHRRAQARKAAQAALAQGARQ